MDATNDPTKILGKGPEYLRKQMELESETKGGMSAVERLAATKAKYVKSQQVVNSTQEPAISLGSASVCSTGSSNRSSNRGVPKGNSSEAPGGAQGSSPGQVRRSSSKKRPDSLLLYRQKCELLKRSKNYRKHHITHKMFVNSTGKNATLPEATDKESGGDKEGITTPEGSAKECSLIVMIPPHEERKNGFDGQITKKSGSGIKDTSAGLLKVPEFQVRCGKKVGRSHSDISSRYSKNFADFDAFFKYCGLDGEVIESLGKENFSARSDEVVVKLRSVSISSSDGSFSRNSGDSDGLLEEELHEKIRQGTSVIERNARIIKWLYSCKNAKDSGKKLRDLD
ncbi:protein FAM110C [Aulostomus maculatus]